MQRRRFLQTTAATALLTATSAPTAAATRKKKTQNVLGNNIAYIDEGEGRPVVFLHGNPTSSYLWRNVIPYVTDNHRAMAPDLLGMGDSDKPVLKETYKEVSESLFAFLDGLDLQDAVLVIHDWGSCLGWHYARTRPEKVSAICFMEAMTPPFMPIASYESLGPFEDFLCTINTPGAGEKLIMEDNYFLDQFLGHGSPNGPLPADVMAEYNRYYPTVESRQILLDWPREIPVAGSPADMTEIVQANGDWLLTTEFPKLMFHVDPGAVIPVQQAKWLKQNLMNIEAVFLGQGGHFLQEDFPDEIGRGLADWLTRV